MKEKRKDNTAKDIQWHPAFVSAMNLEFSENRQDLVFEREYNLNTKPLEIDLLIIKKEKEVPIRNKILFPTQVIAVRELKEKNHAYLRVLTRRPEKGDVSRFLELYKDLSGKAEREYAESILEVFTEANEKWMERWKGEDGMGPALMRIMEPELCEAKKQGIEEGIEKGIAKGIEEGIEKGIAKGIHGAVDILQNLGLSRAEIKKAVMERYHLTEKETEKYL